MGENIDPTWLCFRTSEPRAQGMATAGSERVEQHYAQLVDYPQRVDSVVAGGVGAVTIGDAAPACRWPSMATDDVIALASAYVPTGWAKLTGTDEADETSALELARSIERDPSRAGRELNAPMGCAVVNRQAETLLIVNDAIGAARIYEMSAGATTAWSNRPGALVKFLGVAPSADTKAWMTLAAASWFLGDTAPIEGMTRLPAGCIVEADATDSKRQRAGAAESLVTSDVPFEELAAAAGEAALDQARTAGRVWPGQAKVDLSGGRDSRLAAAAVVASEIDARFRTSDATPGEGDIARQVIAAAPRELQHVVTKTQSGSATPSTPLIERASHLHLLHDGVRHPQKLRGKMTLPRPRPEEATFSGHGGEIAHGFFYKSKKQLRRVRWRKNRVPDRVMRFFTKADPFARPEAYEEARESVEATLEAGRDAGLRGPVLLDWFYLMDRFAHRSGLGTDSERISVFATPAFIAASFALTPLERTQDRLHDFIIGSLVPEAADVPFFDGSSADPGALRRDRLWEIDEDAAVMDEILADSGAWTDIYDADKVKRAWTEAKAGMGPVKREQVFEGVVYRATFDEHLRRLRT